ncbi:MAG: helix-turn-helix transcriptional regulator [Clostridiales bacterium]|nr:helix-turn-helix transcriptional regulator [Clostridiales bacterium]
MENRIDRKLFLGFISIHVLHHAQKEPFYGVWMIEELKRHGYAMSAGTLYPLLHSMEKDGLLQYENRNVEGKIRKYYSITASGAAVLEKARSNALELFEEIKEGAQEGL